MRKKWSTLWGYTVGWQCLGKFVFTLGNGFFNNPDQISQKVVDKMLFNAKRNAHKYDSAYGASWLMMKEWCTCFIENWSLQDLE